MSEPTHRPDWESLAQWVAPKRVPILFVLGWLLAAGVGYLFEVAITDSWTWGATRLAAVVGVGMLIQAFVWGSTRALAAHHGLIVQLGAGPPLHQRRQAAERATAVAWTATTFPGSTVLEPLFTCLAEQPPQEVQAEVAAFITESADKLACAFVLAPGARNAAVVPSGHPHVLVQAGAALHPVLGDGVRLLADVTDDTTADPFLTFRLPPLNPGAEMAHVEGGYLALLREEEQAWPPQGTARPAAGRAPLGDALPISELIGASIVRFGSTQKGQWGSLKQVPADYEAVLAAAERRLGGQHGATAAQLLTNAPASLAFGFGLVAGRRGWSVTSRVYDADRRTYGPALPGEPVASVAEQLRTFADIELTRTRIQAHARWRRYVWGSSAVLGLASPLVTGAAAIALEWWVAASRPEITPDQRAWLVLVGGTALFAVWSAWRVDRAVLSSPAFVVDVSKVVPIGQLLDPSLTTRTVRLRRELAADGWRELDRLRSSGGPPGATAADRRESGGEPVGDARKAITTETAEWIKARLVDIIVAFPSTEQIKIVIPEAGFGPPGAAEADRLEVTADVVGELSRGFRANQPPTLVIGSKPFPLRPMPADEAERRARDQSRVVKAAMRGMTRR